MNPGAYSKMPFEQYLALAALSASMCHTLDARSPFHAWFDSPWNPNPVARESDTMDLGTYAHACLLEGGTDRLEAVQVDAWSKKCEHNGIDQVAWKHKLDIRSRGKLPILQASVSDVREMVTAAKSFIANSEISGVFDTGEAEQTLIWDQDGVLCRIRPDWMNAEHSIMLHYKTTGGSAEPNSWIRNHLIPDGYDVTAAFYERGILATFEAMPLTVFFVQEQKRPFSCSLVGLSPAMSDIAHRKVERAIATWGKCLHAGKWPSYPNQICYAEPTNWQMAEAEEGRMLTENELASGIPL